MYDAEERIKWMQNTGRQVLKEATEYVEKVLQCRIIGRVAAFSGGDDSIVATHFANSEWNDCVTFNANTLVGLKPTRDHIDSVIKDCRWNAEIIRAEAQGPPKRTETNGWLIDNWREGKTAYEEYVLNNGFGGPPQHPRMYQRLKERCLMRLRRRLRGPVRGGRLIVVSGIRHDESAIRAGYKRAWQDVPKQGVIWVNPFYDCTAADFAMYRDEFGLPRNPVKTHCGISGECCCGTFGSKCERLAYRTVDPDFANYLDDLEKQVKERFPWGWGEGPPQWWMDMKRGQGFLFEPDDKLPIFQPMCVGCNNGRR